MKKNVFTLALLCGMALVAPRPAAAGFLFSFAEPGFSLFVGAPCPPPAAVYYPSPVVYYPRPVYYVSPPVVQVGYADYGRGWGHFKNHSTKRSRKHFKHHKHGHWFDD
jgi:hypothetical protein